MQCAEMVADLYDFRKKSDTKNKIIRSKYFRKKKITVIELVNMALRRFLSLIHHLMMR